MITFGNYIILKNRIIACDYKYILAGIQKYTAKRETLLLSPLASYTLVLAYFDNNLKERLKRFDYLLPDSQWIRRSFNFLYGVEVKDRVYGPELMLKTCSLAQKEKYKIFLYGTTDKTLKILRKKLKLLYPKLNIAGSLSSKFRDLNQEEKMGLITKIEKSKTDILFIALGSPQQEIFAYELVYKDPKLKRPIVIMPFGAAFDFISGIKPQAPKLMQHLGLEWLFRLLCEPRRLWKRYLIYGPLFIVLVIFQRLSMLLKLKDSD